jgi:uncharacterized protein YbbC (DUF1343 family)
MSILFGIDVLLSQRLDLIAGRRVGLISNASGVTRDLASNVDALRSATGARLVALFGPEHGFSAIAADGAPVSTAVDARTGLPVYSLYGEVRQPTAEMMAEIDVLVFDIQAVGVRFYTYITTLLNSMQAAAERGLSFVVCDRPNPIGGEILEGPLLEQGFESFVGPGPLPIRHGLTIGELARLYNDAWGAGCDLTVIPCTGWRRDMWYGDTGLPWVPPSPGMPWPETAVVYPGTCLVEGSNLSEGRGTTLPFHLVGAPWIDGHRMAEAMNELSLPGVIFRPVLFKPAADKWSGQRCSGVQLHVTDRASFRPVTAGLHLLAIAQSLYRENLVYRTSGRHSEHPHIDLLAGTARVRAALKDGENIHDLVASWADELDDFARMAREIHLYT